MTIMPAVNLTPLTSAVMETYKRIFEDGCENEDG